MSAQPVENDLPVDLVEGGDDLDLSTSPEVIEVRRNAAVSMVIGLAASAIAIAYLWRAAESGAFLDWLLCLVMGAMATGFLRSLLDARSPLLVADELGVRVRLGAQWRGLPWEAVDRVVVKPRRGTLHDGRLIITLYHVARAIEGLEGRARRHAALNQKLYGAALAVPLGLTTRTSGSGEADLGDRIAELAQGRTEVVTVVDEDTPLAAAGAVVVDAEERPVIADDEPLTADRRPRWMRKVPTVTVTSEDEVDETPVVEEARTSRAIPFRIGQRKEAHVTRLDDADDEVLLAEPLPEPVVPSSRVRSIATLGDPVAPLVIDDFRPEPAYDPVIGPELAAARTRVGLSVDQLAERTRIRPHVIESIEVDDFAPCGGDFYARGHIRTLARVLGKDPAPMLAHFESRYAHAPVSARKVFEAELATGMTGGMRRGVGGPNWALLVGSVLLLVLVWSGVRLFAGDPNPMLENPPPVLNGSAGLGNVYDQPSAPAVRPVQTVVTAVDAGAHVEVRDGDGALVFQGDLVIGESKTVQVDPPVTVSTDNGGALSVKLGGKDLGLMGEPDQPATQTYQRP